MCVILICPPNARPSLETLRDCERANPHGAGLAWREGSQVFWIKTNDVEEIHRLAQAKHGEIVIHFRIASVGGICNDLRHPFPVTPEAGLDHAGSTQAVLFQNGTWGGWREALEIANLDGHATPAGRMSDARAAAWLCSIYGPTFVENCGSSRWVFYGTKETALYGQWFKRGGLRFSNLYWVREPTRAPKPVTKPVCKPLPTPPPSQSGWDRELELWNMKPTRSYWEIVGARKPVRKHH